VEIIVSVSLLINIISWVTGALLALYLTKCAILEKGKFIGYGKKALYTAIWTFVDFKLVVAMRYMLGGATSTSVGFSTAIACAGVSIVCIWARSEKGSYKINKWLFNKRKTI